MSCETPTSISRSLSPSDESRFVPHSSVLEASSVMEQHFTASEQAEKSTGDDKVHVEEEGEAGAAESEAVGSTTQDPSSNSNTLVVDDDEKSGIVGATICFTPEPSPRSSPTKGIIQEANTDSLNSNRNNYIGSVNGIGSGDGVSSSKLSSRMSNSLHVESSLDGRSTTECKFLLFLRKSAPTAGGVKKPHRYRSSE